MHLSDIAPLTHDADCVLTFGQTIHNILRQQWSASGNLFACPRHKSRRPDVLLGFGSLGNQSLVLLPRQNCDLSAWRLLKPNIHGILSIVYFSAVPASPPWQRLDHRLGGALAGFPGAADR